MGHTPCRQISTKAGTASGCVSALGVAALHALLGYVFLTSLGFDLTTRISNDLKIFNVAEEPPPPAAELPNPDEAEADTQQTKDPEGAASPPNLKDTPTEIMVPEPLIKIEVPPPVIAAPAAGQGNAESAGATNIVGPGTGSGGVGTGLGSGLDGDGTGGGGGGRFTHARWISGSHPRFGLSARRLRGRRGRHGLSALRGRAQRPGQRMPGDALERPRRSRRHHLPADPEALPLPARARRPRAPDRRRRSAASICGSPSGGSTRT